MSESDDGADELAEQQAEQADGASSASSPDPSNQAEVPDLDDLDDQDLEEIGESVASESSDDDQEDESAELQEPSAKDVVEGDISVGHVYCRTLGVGAAVLVTRYDENEDDPDELVEEYAGLAKQTDLDQYMDQWFAENMGGAEMSPGQGLAVGTCLFFAMVAMQNPAVMDGLASEVDL